MIVSFRDSWLRDFFVNDSPVQKNSGKLASQTIPKVANAW